jgi:hypothetical protein
MERVWNSLEIMEENPINCVMYVEKRMGRVSFRLENLNGKVSELPHDFKFFVSESHHFPDEK